MSLESPFLKFPVFETKRLALREIRLSDADEFFTIKSDAGLTAKYGREPHSNVEQTMKWIQSVIDSYEKKNALFWSIIDKRGGKLIGGFTIWNIDLESFCGELGYELHRSYWGQGIATEALQSILEYVFLEMGMNRIEACPLDENTPSKRLLEKFGFRYEGNLRQRIYFDGSFHDQLYYSLLKSEWMSGQSD